MHAAFFSLKRAFHGFLRVARRPLACLGLTPARFDMLYVVLESGRGCGQSHLRRKLGVSAPTVSRMLGSLEALGWVVRERALLDRRERVVSLTYAGKCRIQAAYDELIGSGAAELALDCGLAFPKQHERRLCGAARRTLARLLQCVRSQFGDTARLAYDKPPPWVRPTDPGDWRYSDSVFLSSDDL
jgi:DNA-binding MarR family transcriptional regulator